MGLDYVVIGKRIRELRKEKKWTQEYLAEKAGIEPSNLSHIERAATKLSLPTLVNIANALDATLDEIVYDNLAKNTHVSVKLIDELLADCSPQELKAIGEMIATTKHVLRSTCK
ncbi:MAG: helix-turn-helix transcriptional regulator [Clostridia bacterium]|nr:helix-turn-helix transcriptional regulator [Clostridia bacterium]MBQ9133482.1 helix-turn-helix transcriptional regulator [Clostridia bacterium]